MMSDHRPELVPVLGRSSQKWPTAKSPHAPAPAPKFPRPAARILLYLDHIECMFFTLAPSPYKDGVKLALAQQITILILTAGVLDGGDLFSICLIPFLAFWACVFLIRQRRPDTPTKFDLFFIKWSYMPLCVAAFFLVHLFWRLRGLPGLL